MLQSLTSYDSGKLVDLTPEPQGCPAMGQLQKHASGALRKAVLYPAELPGHMRDDRRGCGGYWSGRRESNPRIQLGRLLLYH